MVGFGTPCPVMARKPVVRQIVSTSAPSLSRSGPSAASKRARLKVGKAGCGMPEMSVRRPPLSNRQGCSGRNAKWSPLASMRPTPGKGKCGAKIRV